MSFCLSRRHLLALASAALATPGRAGVAARPVVVELFTSQSCSSCPPADSLFDTLQAMPGIIALSYHVDYWDYLGWRDTLGSADASQRQYAYAKSRGDMDVYTPQLIINGVKPLVASHKAAVMQEVAAAVGRGEAPQPDLHMSENATDLMIDIGAGQSGDNGTVWLVPWSDSVSVHIEKGENGGLDMVYHKVARKIIPAGMWHGAAMSLVMPKADLMPRDCDGCVALLQRSGVGPVLGAANLIIRAEG
jgi:hypothetical protein